MIDPWARQLSKTPSGGRVFERPDAFSNAELLDLFAKATHGHMSQETISSYVARIRDAIHYFRDPKTGVEVPVRDWTKAALWEYLDFVERNYCASFQELAFQGPAAGAMCHQRVWVGAMPAEEAIRTHCTTCPRFKRPPVRPRIHALAKWYRYLARVGAIPRDLMREVAAEYYEEHASPASDGGGGEGGGGERRRIPSIEEMVRLVNGTMHSQRRLFYALSAKTFYRPNEMLALDRYASFGIPLPEGVREPPGFEEGFPAHPHLPGFHEGGDFVYLPKWKGATDKRKGNRWMIVDSEVRPILQEHFQWWDSHVQRDAQGRPAHTSLFLNAHGRPLQQAQMYPRLFYDDCERLGLMRPPAGDDPGDRADPLRRWTAHCQRHFGEQLGQRYDIPSEWMNHFRGDKLHDARSHYYTPKPEHIQQKYHELIPRLGFDPTHQFGGNQPGAPPPRTLWDVHREALHEAILRTKKDYKSSSKLASLGIRTSDGETRIVPQRDAPALLFAIRCQDPSATPHAKTARGASYGSRYFRTKELLAIYEEALSMLV